MSVAVTATSALRNEDSFIRLGEIVDSLARFVVVHDGTDGDFDFKILAVGAMTVAAFAVTTTVSAERMAVAKLQERVLVDFRGEINVAAITAVSAAGAASRDKLFPPERDTTVTAVPCLDCDFGFVDERSSIRLVEWR
jgi:hypothetical protein